MVNTDAFLSPPPPPPPDKSRHDIAAILGTRDSGFGLSAPDF